MQWRNKWAVRAGRHAQGETNLEAVPCQRKKIFVSFFKTATQSQSLTLKKFHF